MAFIPKNVIDKAEDISELVIFSYIYYYNILIQFSTAYDVLTGR